MGKRLFRPRWSRKVRARQFGGKPLQPEAEQSPILPHVIRGSRFAVPGEDRRGERSPDSMSGLAARMERVDVDMA